MNRRGHHVMWHITATDCRPDRDSVCAYTEKRGWSEIKPLKDHFSSVTVNILNIGECVSVAPPQLCSAPRQLPNWARTYLLCHLSTSELVYYTLQCVKFQQYFSLQVCTRHGVQGRNGWATLWSWRIGMVSFVPATSCFQDWINQTICFWSSAHFPHDVHCRPWKHHMTSQSKRAI